MDKESKEITRGVYKTQDFEAYSLWKSLPSFWRGLPRQVLEKYGVDDDVAVELLQIKSQKEFAEKYNIKDLNTLSDWNKKLSKENTIPTIHSWARKLTPNVISALYKTATTKGRAQEVKAWMEIVEGM